MQKLSIYYIPHNTNTNTYLTYNNRLNILECDIESLISIIKKIGTYLYSSLHSFLYSRVRVLKKV